MADGAGDTGGESVPVGGEDNQLPFNMYDKFSPKVSL